MAWTAWQSALAIGFPHAERLAPAVLKAAGRRGCTPRGPSRTRRTRRRWAPSWSRGPAVRGPTASRSSTANSTPPRGNTLGAALLHLTMPGVPDLYMGSETAYLALVDPDNRRPPELRPALLAELDAGRARRACRRRNCV
ncbi:hypothetical protein NKH77_39625 [Streptomyces sp. M19]